MLLEYVIYLDIKRERHSFFRFFFNMALSQKKAETPANDHFIASK